jgi:hypothetical protein
MGNVDWWTRGVAIYGAALATAGGIVQFIQHRRTAARVKLEWSCTEKTLSGSPPFVLVTGDQYKITATNSGGQTISTKAFRLHSPLKHQASLDIPFKHRLEPSESASQEITMNEAANLRTARKVAMVDTAGREWALAHAERKRLKSYFENREETNEATEKELQEAAKELNTRTRRIKFEE